MNRVDQIFTEILLALYFTDQTAQEKDAARSLIGAMVDRALQYEPHEVRERLRRKAKSIRPGRIPRAPPEVLRWLDAAIVQPALLNWARDVAGTSKDDSGGFELRVLDWFQGLPVDDQTRVLGAAVRHVIGLQANSDGELREMLMRALFPKENSMASHLFAFDTRGLPDSFKVPAIQQAWQDAVEAQIANLGLPKDDTVDRTAAIYAVIKGMLLLDEVFDPNNAQFAQAVQRLWIETLATTLDALGNVAQNRDVYPVIADLMGTNGIVALNVVSSSTTLVTLIFQQFASVSRYVVANAQEVPFRSPLFSSQVRLGMDRYVSGPPPAETLDIPPLTGPSGPDGELDPQNMLAFSTLYAIKNLDDMGVYKTLDWAVDDFLNGILASGFDSVGKQLDAWFWGRRDRMTEPDRLAVYSRMMGAAGGDVPRDIQPNSDFNDRLMGFISSVAEFDRQQRIADLFSSSLAGNRGRSLAMTMENVRQKGHDLASNMSLYAYGYAHFAARRLNADLGNAFEFLKNPQLQRLLGVTNPFQVIEKIFTQHTGKAPDIIRLRTMAESGKKILDIVARNFNAWTTAAGLPLFPDLSGITPPSSNASAISIDDTQELIRQVQFWLAVNGVPDQQVDTYARPALKTYEPSIPSSTMLPSASMNGSGAAMDKIKQMMASGQAPSLDQLKSMLPGGFTH